MGHEMGQDMVNGVEDVGSRTARGRSQIAEGRATGNQDD
jgi:hypothetical protein